jgi:exosortase/archaeosortase family protein
MRDHRLVPLALAFGLLLAFVMFGPREPVRAGALGWFDRTTAASTAAVVRLLGTSAVQEGPVLRHPQGFAIEVYYRCTGLLPALFVAVSILAFPAPRELRWKGVIVGVPLLLGLNLTRLVILFVVGVHWPIWFDVAHRVIAEAIMALAVLGLWLAWLRWARTRVAAW